MKVTAIYKKRGLNPFMRVGKEDDFKFITADVPDGLNWYILVEMAQDICPGYDFMNIREETEIKFI